MRGLMYSIVLDYVPQWVWRRMSASMRYHIIANAAW